MRIATGEEHGDFPADDGVADHVGGALLAFRSSGHPCSHIYLAVSIAGAREEHQWQLG